MVGKQYVKLSEKMPEIFKIALTDNPQSRLNIMRLEAFSDFHDVIQKYYDVSNVVTEAENILIRCCDSARVMEIFLYSFRRKRNGNFTIYDPGLIYDPGYIKEYHGVVRMHETFRRNKNT